MGSVCSLLYVLFLDSQLVVSRSQIYLREHPNTLQLIKQVIYSWEWVPVLHRHFIQLTIINAKMKGTILLLYKQYRSSQGKLRGWMKPLSNNS
jgi:hypothetical protein